MATTSTFNLRKLIQTRLHQDDAIPEDDSSSCYEDDQRNPIKRRLTTWLGPRRGSTAHAAHGRSLSDVPRSVSPHPPGYDHVNLYRQQVQVVTGLLNPTDPYVQKATPNLDPRSRTLNDVHPGPNPEVDDTNINLSDASIAEGDITSQNTERQSTPQSKIFIIDSESTDHTVSNTSNDAVIDNSFAIVEEPTANMETTHENRSDPTLNRQSLTRDWSEGVRQLIHETELAFGNSLNLPKNLELPRLSQDLSRSNPNLAQLAPSPLLVDKSESAAHNSENKDVGPKAEVALDITPRRTARIKEEFVKSERRKSRSVPPPIRVRRASSPQDIEERKRSPLGPLPKSAHEEPGHGNSHNRTPPLKHSHTLRVPQKQSAFVARRPSKTSRWGIPDNVTGILTGNMFRRHEVDEILTSEQLEKLKMEREDAKRKKIREALKAAKTTTRNEDSIEDQGNEHVATGVACEISSAHELSEDAGRTSEEKTASSSEDDAGDAPPLPLRKDHHSTTPKHAEKRKRNKVPDPFPIPGDDDLEVMVQEELAAKYGEDAVEGLKTVDLLDEPSPMATPSEPPLPPKNPRRFAPPMAELPELPTKEEPNWKDSRPSMEPEEDDQFLYFKSTPYSLTTPRFRHGRIAFAKSEIGKGARTMDDTLDWTAFQMAILGAGDILTDVYDESDSRLAEEMKDWCKDLGFDHYGSLVPETIPESPRSSSRSTISSAASENDLDLPAVDQTQNWDYDTTKFFQGNGFKGWTVDGKPPIEGAWPQKGNNTSGPGSPMMPMVVDNDDGEISVHEEEVSLGYNLENDLGDFLQWEAQHAVGPGYYGSH